MNHVFLPININDNHNKSTQELLHHIILNNSAISDKYKSLTIINNTINYNTNIKNFDNDLFKENLKDLNLKKKKNSKKNVLNINNDIDSEYSEITKSIATSQQKEQINNLKNNLKSEFKEAKNIQGAKSVSSKEREIEQIKKQKIMGYRENEDIISSENIMVNIEEISSSNKININNDNIYEESLNNEYIDDYNNIFHQNNILRKENHNENYNDKSTQNNDDIINPNNISKIKVEEKKINNNNAYDINFDSPNKGANLVKKGRKKISKNNLIFKFKNGSDIIKLSKLNDTLGNDIIFFFVDEETNKGAKLLSSGFKYFVQNINGKQIMTYIFDMNNKSENNKMDEGINILLTELHLHKIVKIVLACGDESIFPFIEKLNNYSINFDKIIFCVLPFGRSNDLSIQFGFGKSNLFSNININSFKKIISEIIESTSIAIDIWEIKLTFDSSNGGYISINDNFQKYLNKTTTLYRGFISYFSLGYDSRIGFDISQKNYNKSKFCYYCCFYWEALKKNFCTKTIKLNQFLDSLYYINLHKIDSSYDDERQTTREDRCQKIPIFQTTEIVLSSQRNDNISINNSKSTNRIVPNNDTINNKNYKKNHNITNEEDEENEIEESDSENENEEVDSALKTFKYEKVMIKGEPMGLICQNIKYFCDGNISKWDSKKPKYGIQIKKKISIDSVNKSNKELKKVSIFYLI